MSCAMNASNTARTWLKYLVTQKTNIGGGLLLSHFLKWVNYEISATRFVHASVVCNASHFKPRDRREMLKTMPKLEDGLEGEHYALLNASIVTKEDMFTDERTPDLLFNGVPFNKIPICNIQVTKNNAKFRIGDADNKLIVFRSNGMEGFKKCRKGTNVAAQSTALTVGNKALAIGVKDIRIKIQGLGPGRMAAIKGLEMAGLNIISITDDTRISWKPSARPRKVRRV